MHRTFASQDKYRTVGALLQGASGRVLDVGARDRRLAAYLGPGLVYHSADLGPGHDLALDLERPLDLPDRAYDHVVALDVLEHVERTHDALRELARIASQQVIVALPNLATLRRRVTFLLTGTVGTRKYDLEPEHQGDRHRWLTTYAQMNRFVEEVGRESGFRLASLVEELEAPWPGRVGGRAARLGSQLVQRGWLAAGGVTGRCIYVLTRDAP